MLIILEVYERAAAREPIVKMLGVFS